MFILSETSTPKKCSISYYNSLCASFPQYGIVAWGLTYDLCIKPVFTLKKAVRAIAVESYNNAPSSPIFLALVLLKLQDLFELKLSSFVYESVDRISPSCFHGFLNLLSNVHEHHTRQASRTDIFLTRKFTLQYGLKSVRYASVKSWNSISIQIQQAFSIKVFRRQVKLYLLSINNQSKSLENVYLTTSLFK